MLPSEVEKQDYYKLVQVLTAVSRLNKRDETGDKPQRFKVPGPE